MDTVTRRAFQFERYTLDVMRGCLRKDDREIELRPKSFDVLRYFVEHAGRLIPKDEIVKAVWPHVVVTDDSLTQCVSEVRVALGDAEQRIIKTLRRRGYRFTAAVRESSAPSGSEVQTDAASERPSIAVLPFLNMSRDSQDEYFADGLTEDVITSLSKFSELFVIARTSAFKYKNKPVDAGQAGRELGVRYLAVGSVRRGDDRVRVTARLIDTLSGVQRWAEHYDRHIAGIFALQDELVEKIVVTLAAQVARSERQKAMRKPPESLAAYEHYLQGNARFKTVTQGERGRIILEARHHYSQSLAADPHFAQAVAALANTYIFAWLEPTGHEVLGGEYREQASCDRALALAQQAVALDDQLAEAHAALAWILHWHYRRDEGIGHFERAVALNPNLADGRHSLMLTHNGRAAEAVDVMRRIMRLDPFHPPLYRSWLGNAYFMLERYDLAYRLLQRAASEQPNHRPSHVWLAAVAAKLGYREEARFAGREVMRIDPEFRTSAWLKLLRLAREADAARLAGALRAAGLPD